MLEYFLRRLMQLLVVRISGHVRRRSKRAFVAAGVITVVAIAWAAYSNGSVFPVIWSAPFVFIIGMIIACPLLPLPHVRGTSVLPEEEGGAVIQHWQYDRGQLVVLLEHAVYLYPGDPGEFPDVLDALGEGKRPSTLNGSLVSIDKIRRIAFCAASGRGSIRRSGGWPVMFYAEGPVFGKIVAHATSHQGVTPTVGERGPDVGPYLLMAAVAACVAFVGGIMMWPSRNLMNPPATYVIGILLAGISSLMMLFGLIGAVVAIARRDEKVQIVATFDATNGRVVSVDSSGKTSPMAAGSHQS